MKNKIQFYLLIIFILLIAVYFWHSDIKNLLKYGLGNWPTHESSEKCPWVKENFEKAGISAFVENCRDSQAFDPIRGYAMIFSDTDKKVVGKFVTNQDSEFTIEVFSKEVLQNPIDIVNEWYSKLTSEQQKVCEIQNVDVPITYFSDGSINFHERPNPTPNKIRYAIGVKSEIVKQIWDKYGGDPGGGQGRDFMCGDLLGTTWGSYPPYFEFDDRNPSKYLFIDSYSFEAPPIDLNSIQF